MLHICLIQQLEHIAAVVQVVINCDNDIIWILLHRKIVLFMALEIRAPLDRKASLAQDQQILRQRPLTIWKLFRSKPENDFISLEGLIHQCFDGSRDFTDTFGIRCHADNDAWVSLQFGNAACRTFHLRARRYPKMFWDASERVARSMFFKAVDESPYLSWDIRNCTANGIRSIILYLHSTRRLRSPDALRRRLNGLFLFCITPCAQQIIDCGTVPDPLHPLPVINIHKLTRVVRINFPCVECGFPVERVQGSEFFAVLCSIEMRPAPCDKQRNQRPLYIRIAILILHPCTHSRKSLVEVQGLFCSRRLETRVDICSIIHKLLVHNRDSIRKKNRTVNEIHVVSGAERLKTQAVRINKRFAEQLVPGAVN